MKTLLASLLACALATPAVAGPDFITTSPRGGALTASPGTSEIGPLDDVVFEHDSSALAGSSIEQLDSAARWLRQHRSQRVVVEGYADSSGGTPYNQDLATRRAKVVRKELLDRGVARDRIVLAIYGETGARASAHPLDRRVVVWASTLPAEQLVASAFDRKQAIVAMWTRGRAVFTETRSRRGTAVGLR